MTLRSLSKQVLHHASKYPILAVTGPRQAGKTTFLKTTFADYRYISLENPDLRAFALDDPKGFLAAYNEKVIFDEIQCAPDLFPYLQGLVDEQRVMGQFILSGSQNFQLMEKISQSLAGRVGVFKMYPFDLTELKRAGWMKEDVAQQIFTGAYPAIYDRNISPTQYFADYLETYVYRDIRSLKNIQDFDAFDRLIKVCANHIGQIVNYQNFSALVGVSHTTIKQWISLLKTSYILFELPPFFNNFNKRLVKSPKLYFYDTGLASRLLGLKENQLSPEFLFWGPLFENYVVAEFVKQNAHGNLNQNFFYWRDSNGHEVDILFQDGPKMHLIEIKAGKTIKSEMFKNLDFVAALVENFTVKKSLIYGGITNQKRTQYDVIAWSEIDLKEF
jgi:predicted AAA+ superfamily ATPase